MTSAQPAMLSFVPAEMEEPAPYHLLTSVVAPRPIAWVSTLSAEGIPNLAPYSFFNAVAGFPPTIMFSVAYRRRSPQEKDTLRNVKAIPEFVCHVADESLAAAMVKTATEWPYGVNEFEQTQLKAVASVDVRPPRVAAATVAMECKVTQLVPVEGATNVMVLGEVLRFHIRPDLYRDDLGLVDTVKMQPITRMGGPVEYAKIGEKVCLERPS
ncbi:flavin reductase family protein [Almyronema epifaneia]|uniref:Flavin reductase family protein n=1 Tax=Almyronema epifaneia S1 TaxID=2991925 RepID=A0ABW6IIV4_9CYAN